MREIKFRGVANREGGGIELVYGDLSTNCNDGCVYKDTHPDRISWRTETGGFASKPIRKGTRMQFTGSKDKNGKEVYEGDIVRKDGWSEPDEWRWVIEWSEKDSRFKPGGDFLVDCEVIGNIFANPELLEQ